MELLYSTVIGRLLLKFLLHSRMLKAMAKLAESPISKIAIKPFIRRYQIDMSDFYGQEYENFAEFFARKKNEDAQIINASNVLISPCDGLVSVYNITDTSQFFIKGSHYSIGDLISQESKARQFDDGLCLVFRLRGSDYHRFCFIDDCTPGDYHFIEGQLHSVQPIALAKHPVFRLNRRVWSIMETANFGPVGQIEVGAVLVGGIEHERIEGHVRRGMEMGHFALCGSSIVILLTAEVKEHLKFSLGMQQALEGEQEFPVKMGQLVGVLNRFETEDINEFSVE